MLCVIVYVLLGTLGSLGSAENDRLVYIDQGPVRGYKDGDIYTFHGIPYATTPVGTQKFQPPLPPPTWTEPFEAIDQNIACPQRSLSRSANEGVIHEDCLVVNIFVPDKVESVLPVVIYFHGGAFQAGFGNRFTPKNLVHSKRVVAVTFNYRLGASGFLCLGTRDISGNAGLKDQAALLKWVKANIVSFGGNPDDVTIAGSSAGATSVGLVLFSKMTTGLFNKIILESASSVGSLAVQSEPLENAKNYAKLLNFTEVNNMFALEDFFKTASIDLLNSIDITESTDSGMLFSPCIERDTGIERFLEESPEDMLKSSNYNKVPMLYGISEMEGIYRIDMFDLWKDLMNEDFSVFLPADLQFTIDEEKRQLANEIKKKYFGDQPVSPENILSYIDFFSDVMFAHPVLRSVKYHIDTGHDQIYLYEYSFFDENVPYIPYTNNLRGTSHSSQSRAVLDGANSTYPYEDDITEDYKKMKIVMRELWLNFITTGQPVPEGSKFPSWPPVGEYRSPHMSLDRTLELRGPLLQRRAEFWDDIYSKYSRHPSPPLPF